MWKIDLTRRAKRKQAVILHTLGGWTTNVILIVQGLVMVPLYLNFLGERLYGFWLASGGILAWLSMVNVGAGAITQQRCAAAHGRKDLRGVADYFWHGLVITAGVLILFAAGLVFLGFNFAQWLGVDPEYRAVIRDCFFLAGVGSVLGFANSYLAAFAAGLQRNYVPLFGQALGDVLCLAVMLVGLVVLRLGLYSLAIGMIVKAVVPLLANLAHTVLIVASTGVGARWSKTVFQDYLKTSPALLASKSMGVFATNLPQILIARWIGPEATVAYSVTLRVLRILQNFINHGLGGLYAAFSHFFHDPEVDPKRQLHLARRAAWSYILLAGTSLLLFTVFNHGFVALWTSETHFAGQLFTALAATAMFLDVRSNFLAGLGGATGRIREAQIVKMGEYVVFALFIPAGLFSLGLVGIPVARILAALAAQAWLRRVVESSGPVLGEALRPIYWTWLPLSLLLLSVSAFSPFFLIDRWPPFILACSAASVPVVAVLLLVTPELRGRVRALARVPLQRFGLIGSRP